MAAAVRGVAFSKSKFAGDELAVAKAEGAIGVLVTCMVVPPKLKAGTVQASPSSETMTVAGKDLIGDGVALTLPARSRRKGEKAGEGRRFCWEQEAEVTSTGM